MYSCADDTNDVKLPVTEVEAERGEDSGFADEITSESTRWSLDIKQTHQSMNVNTNQVIQDFNLIRVQDVMNLTPGINVERVETDRTYFTARGFDVTNFQGDIDTVYMIALTF